LKSDNYPLKEYKKNNQVSRDICALFYCYEFIIERGDRSYGGVMRLGIEWYCVRWKIVSNYSSCNVLEIPGV
jgi:hypothetical protein